MLPKETLDRAIELAQQAQTAKVLAEVGDPRHVHVQVGDGFTQLDVPPPVRSIGLRSLTALIELCQSEISERRWPTVWHCHFSVVVLLDDADRRDKAVLILRESDAFAALRELDDKREAMDQRRFCSLLRHTLGVDAATVAPFRRLDWSSQKSALGETGPGKDRIGREVRGAVMTSGGEMPEDLLLRVPVYREQGEREPVQVRCAIEVDVYAEKLAIFPFSGEIEEAIDVAQANIRERLDEGLPEGTPVFYGSP